MKTGMIPSFCNKRQIRVQSLELPRRSKRAGLRLYDREQQKTETLLRIFTELSTSLDLQHVLHAAFKSPRENGW